MMMSGCRISQQLGEYNSRQFGICSPLVPARKFTFFSKHSSISKTFLRFRLLATNAASCSSSSSSCSSSSSSSSSVRSNNDDLVGVSCINNDVCTQDKDVSRAPVLSDCLSGAENGCNAPSEGVWVAGGIVALGKFDALHIGHRELVIQAAKIGVPYLLSFVGMAEILGWEPRAPIVAKCDRKRILSSWAPLCGNVAPKEFQVEFSKVRYLTPQQFVEKLSKELQVRGVVAGQNYRFGYRAAGDASDLVRLCKEYGMEASIINSVMDKNQESGEAFLGNSHEQGQVSSTRVRKALANGDMKYVTELLGRPHRLVIKVEDSEKVFRERKQLSAPRSCLLNLPPREGLYDKCSLVIGDENVVPCRVIIDRTDIHLELDRDLAAPITHKFESLGIQFDDPKA